MVTDSSSEGNGSTLPEETELDIPLAGSPIAESAICAFLGNSQPAALLDTRGEPTMLYTSWIKMFENLFLALTAEQRCSLFIDFGQIKARKDSIMLE